MTAEAALSARHDAQRALDRPVMTLADAGRRAEGINSALADLFDVAERDVRTGRASAEVRAAVIGVREARA